MKTIGRIILLICGCCLIGFAIPSFIDAINTLNSNGWNLFGEKNLFPEFSLLISEGAAIFAGLVAIIACLRGKSSFFLFLISLILIGTVIWFFVSAHFAGTLGDWKNILRSIIGFALPIGYFVGALFIKFD